MCRIVICWSVQVTPGGGASVGQILKSTRICKSPHGNVSLAGNSTATVTCTSQSYTPTSIQSTIHVTFVGTRLSGGAANSWGRWLMSIVVNGASIGSSLHTHNSLSEHSDGGPTFGSYVNSSLNPITFTVTLQGLTASGTGAITFYQEPGRKTCFF